MERRECLTLLGALIGVKIGVARPFNKWDPGFIDAVKFDGAVDYLKRTIGTDGSTPTGMQPIIYARGERELAGVPVLKTGLDPRIWNPNKLEGRIAALKAEWGEG